MKNRILFIFVFVSLFPAILSAQIAVTGKITGVVTDSSGSAVPNAMVTVKGTALMTPRTTNTGSDGGYLFDLLPPGTYEVTVSAAGFKTSDETGIGINAGFTATVNAKLQVGEVTQTIQVEGEPVVDVQNVQASTTFDQNLLQDIPSGRDPWSTVAQVPGATISTVDVGGNQSYQQSTMQVHGSTPGEQVFSFNGLDLNWPGANGGYTQFYTDHDSFDEFQVVSDNAPASVAIGGVYMNMVTKSGSNQWHGQAAAYYASAGFEAGAKSPVFNGKSVPAASPIFHDRDTTVGAGGPIWKDRLWIFGSYRRYDLGEDVLSIQTPTGAPGVDIDHQTNTALRLDWQVPSIAPARPDPSANCIAFPGPTIARKGAFEVREVARALDLDVMLLGSDLEGADFWRGVRVHRRAAADRRFDRVAAVVQPAQFEERPRHLLAALAAGIPVIATAGCGLAPRAGLTIVPYGDPTALAVAVRETLERRPRNADANWQGR